MFDLRISFFFLQQRQSEMGWTVVQINPTHVQKKKKEEHAANLQILAINPLQKLMKW